MQDDAQNLPEDPAELRALLLQTRAELQQARATVKHRELEIEKLRMQLAKLRRMQFGHSSERLDQEIAQLELRLQMLEVEETDNDSKAAVKKSQSRKSARKPLPDHLPREVVIHTPAGCHCPNCGGELKAIGEDVSEMLEYVPASFKVIRHIRKKLACGGCQTLVQGPAASRPIERGMAAPGLLAQVLVAKYADHLPLYRQSMIYAREGIELERSTLADWVAQLTQLLAPLGDALERHTLSGATLHADDTPVPVLAPGRGSTKTGRFWTYVRDERPAGQTIAPAVWFQYSPDRKGTHPQTHLKDYRGILHADGYAGFNELYRSGGITEAACWAHVRRKFYDIVQANASPVAMEAIEQIAALYAIEKAIRGKPPEDRRSLRKARAGPLLNTLKAWMETQLMQIAVKSSLGQAISYALSRWTALTRYLDDGHIEIDNNAAERALRSIALGRKNYLFVGSDAGGERAALVYSLMESAKLNDINPYNYLAYVIERIADHPINRVDELLPWHVAQAMSGEREQRYATDQEAA